VGAGVLQPLSQLRPTALNANRVRVRSVRAIVLFLFVRGIYWVLSLAYLELGHDCGIDQVLWRAAFETRMKSVNWMTAALDRLANEAAVRVSVQATQGSVPRGSGTHMLVFARGEAGTIGGGHLEFQALSHARRLLAEELVSTHLRQVLGPSLGQCCGGVVELTLERVDASDIARLRTMLMPPRPPLALFGGGHVGKALVHTLAPLPFAVRWVDSRDEIFPSVVPEDVECEHSNPVQSAVADLAPGSRVLIMSFSHAEDLDIVVACLKRQRERGDLPFVGLIGSQTKWATFRHRLEDRGFSAEEIAHITCPIGVSGIRGKEPEVIAVAVAAQLLHTL
jgi:xanthine dehydrogenase accessory factor